MQNHQFAWFGISPKYFLAQPLSLASVSVIPFKVILIFLVLLCSEFTEAKKQTSNLPDLVSFHSRAWWAMLWSVVICDRLTSHLHHTVTSRRHCTYGIHGSASFFFFFLVWWRRDIIFHHTNFCLAAEHDTVKHAFSHAKYESVGLELWHTQRDFIIV